MIGNNVLVAEIEKERTTTGGIILTGETSKANQAGLVLSVGDSVTTVSPKDRIYLDWSKSMPVDVDGQAAVIVDKEYIKAVIG